MISVSVIIPNYNHALFLKQRIESVLNQTFQDFELIMLDDCSTDSSRDIIEMYRDHPKVKTIVYNSINSGSPFKQWKKGIDLANGYYIWIAESDDFSDPTFLEKTVNEFTKNSTLGMVFTNSHWVDSNGAKCNDLSIYAESFTRPGIDEIRNQLLMGNSIQNVSSVLFRSDLLKKVSARYTKYKACGDWVLYVDILKKTALSFLSEQLNYYRFYHNNTSKSAIQKGLWEYEGIDVLRWSNRGLAIDNERKKVIIRSWKKKIKPLRNTIPISIYKYLIIYFKLFLFSPVLFVNVFFLNSKE